MATRHCLRSATKVTELLMSETERTRANDVPSDNEENNSENLTDSESEEDSLEGDSGTPNEDPSAVTIKTEYDNEEQEEVPSAKKRRKSSTQDTNISRYGHRPNVIQGHDGYQWYATAPEKVPLRVTSIASSSPSPIGQAKSAETPLQAWSLLFPDSLLEKIVVHTNEEIARYRDSVETNEVFHPVYNNIELTELKAFIGLLYFSGLQKTCNTNLIDLWSCDYGSTMYRAAMPKRRYEFIIGMIRFDNKTTRLERQETDKFAPIRELWEIFISNCTKYYEPGIHCTIDEQLLSFRGRCPFKVHNGSKPDGYGIKIVLLNDCHTFYMYTAEPYVGRIVTEPNEKLPAYYIRKLSEPLHGTTRNIIICDNWFSSIEIFDKMLKNHSLTMVGTLRKNAPQIPDEFKRAGPISSSKFAFDGTKTLVSYTPKKNKIVILLSTFHHDAKIDQMSQKPEIINFYNSTKGGSNTFDQICREYTTARKTLRWPTRVWWGMLDQGCINAMILYNSNGNNEEMTRRKFMKSLVRDLIDPHLRARLVIPNLRRNLRLLIEEILEINPTARPHPVPGKLARCAFCPRSNDRKSRVACTICSRPVCEDHRLLLCELCNGRD